jgi:Tfp pilus assembly protein PilZ
MTEKRKLDRLTPLVIRTQFSSGGAQHQGFLTNLSETGAFLATEAPLTVGESLDLDFKLPWRLGEHSAAATVAWSTEGAGSSSQDITVGVGLAFAGLTAEAQRAIRGYMEKFYDLLAQIDDKGLTEVLAKLSRETADS